MMEGQRGGKSSRRTGLLAASILSSFFLLTQAQAPTTRYNISISMDPPEALEGQSVNLTLTHETAKFFLCNWYRGTESIENLIVTIYLPPLSGNTFGAAYTGREIPGFNCSLLIENLHLEDSGNYTVTKQGASLYGSGLVNIQVLGKSSGLSAGAIAGIVIGCVAGVLLSVGIVYFLWTKASCWRTEQHASNGNIPSAPGRSQATDAKPKPGEEDLQYSTLAFSTNNASQPASGLTWPLDSGTVYSEIKKK